MRMRLVAPFAVLIAVGSTTIAHAANVGKSMSLENAIEHHRSGKLDTLSEADRTNAVDLVTQNIKACLTFYEPNDCTGPAEEWVRKWNALELASTSNEDPATTNSSALPRSPLVLPEPSLLQWHAPFTKSAADYFIAMPFPYAGATR